MVLGFRQALRPGMRSRSLQYSLLAFRSLAGNLEPTGVDICIVELIGLVPFRNVNKNVHGIPERADSVKNPNDFDDWLLAKLKPSGASALTYCIRCHLLVLLGYGNPVFGLHVLIIFRSDCIVSLSPLCLPNQSSTRLTLVNCIHLPESGHLDVFAETYICDQASTGTSCIGASREAEEEDLIAIAVIICKEVVGFANVLIKSRAEVACPKVNLKFRVQIIP